MTNTQAKNESDDIAKQLLQLLQEILSEVYPQRSSSLSITLDSSFEKDLGLDSLVRVELISRVEQAFKLVLPEHIFVEIETARDLLHALQNAPELRVEPTAKATVATLEAVETSSTPTAAKTLLEVLEWHLKHHPDRSHIQMYEDNAQGESLTYRQLKAGVLKVATGLQQHGLKPAEPVSIMLPSGLDYFYSFLGILLAGGIPVPIYPPVRLSQLEDHMHRHTKILENCAASILITVPEAKNVARLLKAQVPKLQHIVTMADLSNANTEMAFRLPVIKANDIAFIQYTSGSTGNPKGVVLTHANLLANIRAMGQAVDVRRDDVFISWLPLYHDMGLIGAWLGSMYFAILFVVMQPLHFLARPERWLRAIHRYQGTLSASPNFGYEYCLRRIRDEDLQGLDLSSWRAAFNGAEAVNPDTLQQFTQRFSCYGFAPTAMMPVYGLAESSVGLAFPPLEREVLIDRIDRTTFMKTGKAVPVSVENSHDLRFPSCGRPLVGHQIRIADSAGRELPERQQGRLQFQGPSSTHGYYHNAEKTQELFEGEWLNSGDLAYIAKGEVYLTGRSKDIIIRAGRNIYPDELEYAVGNISGIRKGRVAVFASKDERSATERLVVLTETRSKDKVEREKLRSQITALATDLIGVPPDEVVLAPPGTVLKTSSGKIRRAASREFFEKGDIGKKRQGMVWQMLRLALGSLVPQVRRAIRYTDKLLYAVYCGLLYFVLLPIAWLSAVLIPKYTLRWAMVRRYIQLLIKLSATPLKVNGLENLPVQGQPYVIVANHTSYLDSFALMASLPRQFRFVTKKEFAQNAFTRLPLERIHAEFVDRFNIAKSVSDAQRLSEVLKAGHALFFFAEGTFTRIPGLAPFRMGAFTIAAENNVPIIPLAIRGTRSILRERIWFPHRGSIHIEIGKPIYPADITEGDDKERWSVAIQLRDQSRAFILRHCGEPDLLMDQ